jgi:tetratricopeptide (TPR) repeat protein
MGKNDEAIQQYRNAVRLNLEHNIRSPWPPMNLGTLLTKLDRLDEAEPLFRESLQFDANFAQSHYQLGVLLQKQNKIPAAVEELKRAAALDPVYSEPHYALARLYRRAGDLEQAQQELQIFQDLKAKEPAPRLE